MPTNKPKPATPKGAVAARIAAAVELVRREGFFHWYPAYEWPARRSTPTEVIDPLALKYPDLDWKASRLGGVARVYAKLKAPGARQ